MAVYDIAARQRLPSELRAIRTATERERQSTRIIKQSADYYDASGGSEALQKDTEISIANQNMQARWGELSRNLDNDSRNAADKFFEQIAAVQRYIELNPDDMEGAKTLYDNARDANLIPQTGHPLSKFDPKTVRSIAQIRATTDPDMPWNWYNTDTGERGSVDPHDRKSWASVMGPNVLFGRGDLGTGVDGGIGKPEAQAIRDTTVAAKTYLGAVNDLAKLIKAEPDANTWTARGVGVANEVRNEVRGLVSQLGLTAPENIMEPDTYKDTWRGLAINNSRIRGLSTALAYGAAAVSAAQQSGRSVSNVDVENYMKETGLNSGDPQVILATVLDLSRRIDRFARINYKERIGEDYDGDLGLASIEETLGFGSENPEDITTELNDLEELRRTDPTKMTVPQMQRLLELRNKR